MDLLPINIWDTWEVAKNKINNSYNKMVEEVREQQPSIRDWFWYIWDINTWIKAQWPQGNPWTPWENWEPWEKGDTWNGIASIVATKNWKITTLTLTYTDWNKEYFQISDWQDWLPWTPWKDWEDWKPWKDWEDGKPWTNWIDWNWITSVVSSKSWKTTTVTMNFTRGIPTTFQVQDWADWQPWPKWEDWSDYIITEEDYQEIADKVEKKVISLEEWVDYTAVYNATKLTTPYSAYWSVDITITKEWVERKEWNLYLFIVKDFPWTSTYRNVRVKIWEDWDRHWLWSVSSISSWYSYFTKATWNLFKYTTAYYEDWALHNTYVDSNTTYAYLVNTVVAWQVEIDSNGYWARYSLLFPTTPLWASAQKWSSLKGSSSTAAKAYCTKIEKFYVDRMPLYIYSANIDAGAVAANSLYEAYTTHDIRYTWNGWTWTVTPLRRLFIHLRNFDISDYSFNVKDTTSATAIIYSDDLIPWAFTSWDNYFLYVWYNTTNRYTCQPDFMAINRIYKYSASTWTFTPIL